jgi:CubicO group peptidase (beta-lactamase class C family)
MLASAAATAPPTSRPTGPAEVARQVELFLSPGGRYDDLITAVLLTVNGKPVVEHYGPNGAPGKTGQVFSVTKTVMSMLIGIAIEEGAIAGVDRTLAELLPTYVPIMAPGVGAVTLQQVLTMTGGIVSEIDPAGYTGDSDWVAVTLQTPLTGPPGGPFSYSDLNSHLLSAILTQSTGRSALDYAREKLFGPLGITSEPAATPIAFSDPDYGTLPGFGWATDPQGRQIGAAELKITASDMAKLGQLYLDEGQWAGQQIVPAAWVAESTTRQVDTNSTVLPAYGYQWWVGQADGHPAYAAIGFAGQLIEVVPDLGLVVVMSALDDPARFDAFSFASMVSSQIVPAVG